MSQYVMVILVFGFPLNNANYNYNNYKGEGDCDSFPLTDGCSIEWTRDCHSDEPYVASIVKKLDIDGLWAIEVDLKALTDQENEATERLRKTCSETWIQWQQPKWHQLFRSSY